MSYVVPVKSTVEISQNFVAFSKYMNFIFMKITKDTKFPTFQTPEEQKFWTGIELVINANATSERL